MLKNLIITLLLLSSVDASQRDSITLGTEDWSPFSFKDKKTQQISGLSTEIIYETFKRMDVKIRSNRIMPWARTQKSGYIGKFDAIYTASMNDTRLKYMYFPKEPIISSKWVLFIKKENKSKLKFDDFNSLNGKKICLINGYNYPKFFKKHIEKYSKITITSKENLNIGKLLNNRCDYMPAVLETTIDMTKSNIDLQKIDAYKHIYYFDKPLFVSKFYLMFSKKTVSKEFVDRFSDKLEEFKKTQQYQDILSKYL